MGLKDNGKLSCAIGTIIPNGKFSRSVLINQEIFPDRDLQRLQRFHEGCIFPTGKYSMTPKQIGQIIRETRRAQALRQDQLAGAAGVGLRFVVELEAGKPTAQLGKTLSVLEALGCRLRLEPPASEPTGGDHD